MVVLDHAGHPRPTWVPGEIHIGGSDDRKVLVVEGDELGERRHAVAVEDEATQGERARALAESSPSIVTPLNKYIGYEAAAKIAKHSVAKGITVREATIELGYVDGEKLTMEQLDKALDVLSMTSPGL